MKMARRAWECSLGNRQRDFDQRVLVAGNISAYGWKIATQLYRTINWTWYYDFTRISSTWAIRRKRLSGHWNGYASLMMFVLGAGVRTIRRLPVIG